MAQPFIITDNSMVRENLSNWHPQEMAQATTLPAHYYQAAEILAAEQTSIFARTWQLAGCIDQVANVGDYFTTTINNEPILIIHGKDGIVRGFYNVCRHRAAPVAIGQGNCEEFQCCYHGWRYDLAGKLLAATDFGKITNFSPASMQLQSLSLAIWQKLIFINFASESEPLDTFLAPMPAEVSHLPLTALKRVAHRDYVIKCNWKVYVDNYLEGYHIPIVHPELNNMLDYKKYSVETYHYTSAQHAPLRTQTIQTQLGDWQNAQQPTEAYYYWIFPNLMVNIYPDNFSTNLILPLNERETLTIFEWYYGKDVPTEHINRMVEFSDKVQQEDITICEAVQRGIASRSYNQGHYSPKHENGLYHFHSLLHQFLTNHEL